MGNIKIFAKYWYYDSFLLGVSDWFESCPEVTFVQMMAIWVMLLIFLIHDVSKNNFAGEFSIISEEPSRKKMHLVAMSRLHEFECRLVCSSQTTYVYNIKNDKWSPSQEGNAHHHKKRQFAKLSHLFFMETWWAGLSRCCASFLAKAGCWPDYQEQGYQDYQDCQDYQEPDYQEQVGKERGNVY